MSDRDLRSKLIRLAHEKPELRPALFPILGRKASKDLPFHTIGSATPEEFRKFGELLTKLIKRTGNIEAIRMDDPRLGLGWTVVFSTEYAALKAFYAYRSSNPSLARAPQGWAVSVK